MLEMFDYDNDRRGDGYNLYEKMYLLNEKFNAAVDAYYADDSDMLAMKREEREAREREADIAAERTMREYYERSNPYV